MTYLLTLLALIGCMVALDARFKLFIFDSPIPALLSLVSGTGIFILWDVLAIAEGIFLHLESPWMTGIMAADQLPIEEIFFLLFLCYQVMIMFNGWSQFRRLRIKRQLRGDT